jgi:steroid delta-isomerase-like uncharacterized protein
MKSDIVRRHFTVENQHDMMAMLATMRDEDPVRKEIAGRTYRGREEVAARYQELWDAFPDFRVEPQNFIEGDDDVAVQAIFSGTHLGRFNGFAPTLKSFSIPILVVFRFEADRIASETIYLDYASQLRQLGLLKA